MSSPAIRPSTVSLNFGRKDGEAVRWAKFEGMLEWDRSPESIELERRGQAPTNLVAATHETCGLLVGCHQVVETPDMC